jgi:large subunit ribosomal protein L1
MEKDTISTALVKLKETKRNFSQSFELIVSLKDIDLKKTDNQVDFFAQLPNGTGKKFSICAFVDKDMAEEAKKVCDEVIAVEDFPNFSKNKKLAKKLARKHDYFIAQANLMAQVATHFGRALGPKGKMPNPKAGCIIPPKASIKSIVDNLQKTIRITARTSPVVSCLVGTEKMDNGLVAENVINIYEQIIHHLPNEELNIKAAMVKTTMSSPVKIK